MKEENLNALFLTHHHPDHHQHAPDLARELGVPIYLSQDCYQRILGKFQQDYFHGVEIRVLFEGDSVTRWHGEEVRVFEVPGHDAGQLALAPESLSWFIVGDLIQGIGTVVISEPEGDMATYFKTLEKVIKLQPSVIMPSHGIPMRVLSGWKRPSNIDGKEKSRCSVYFIRAEQNNRCWSRFIRISLRCFILMP